MTDELAMEHARAPRFLVTTEGTRLPLPQKGALTIGSGPGAADRLHFDAPGLEDRHCVIGRTRAGGWALKDLGSHAGSLVNGERVSGARLKRGDVLDLAGVVLRFEGDEDFQPVVAERAPAYAEPSLGRLGGFRLERRLGRGGMGDVLLAVQESLDRRVALKLLKQRLADDEDFVFRFQTEAKSAAALNHPNVVHVYDVGVIDGRHYLAMEYMDGGTLEARVLSDGPLPAAEVHRVLTETAQALAFAEERGIVHRDIKPDNLMLDTTGRVKLADLGLATSIEAEAEDAESGRGARILGTPHFMAPEQARGGKVDQRSDLYALGATAFRLLTAKTPFEGETTRDILRAHFTQPPPLPSSLVAGVPAELDAIVVKLMAKEPSARFQSARALLEALAASKPEAASAQRASKLPLVLVAAALLVVALAWAFLPDSEESGTTTDDTPLIAEGGNPLGAPDAGSLDVPEPSPIDALPGIPEVAVEQPEDNEQLLENLEKLARSAYYGLSPITDTGARKAALEELIGAFPGTTVASEAAIEAAALEGVLAAESAALAAQAADEARLDTILTGVTAQAERLADGAPADPDGLLAALLALEAPGDANLAQLFETKRNAVLAKVFDQANEHLRQALSAAEELAAQGDFDAYEASLQSLTGYFELDALDTSAKAPEPPPLTTPEFPDVTGVGIGGGSGKPKGKFGGGQQENRRVPWLRQDEVAPEAAPESVVQLPPGVAPKDVAPLLDLGLVEFLQLREEVRTKLEARPQREAEYRAALARADRATAAAGLYAGSQGDAGLSGDLSAFRFQAAAARLQKLGGNLKTEDSRAQIASLAAEATSAALAMTMLLDAFGGEGWRRDSVPLPRGGYAKALAIDAAGLSVESDGSSRTYTWDQYQGSPSLIDGLFKNRLRRDYSALEAFGIASLARFAAVQGAIERADRVLVLSEKERFDEADLSEMLDGFQIADTWAETAMTEAPMALSANDRERQAVELLGRALIARVAGQSALSAARLEELLRFHASSLTVLLLSDGRGAASTE